MAIQNIYTVAQVNAYIKNMFTQDFMLQSLSVRGEVSNCKYHSSGHIYFTLKDGKGTIACVMFAGNRSGLAFTLREGMQVVVTGTVDVYERDGKYQLYARQITKDGVGYLYEKFEELKQELQERGMFDAQYKRPVPKYIKTLGVVTAPTGAAIRDIINVAKRRNPYIRIVLYPALVQGEAAAQSIANGIRALEHYGVDTMIVGRGGGSLEDLWAFNEEIVAQAIFDCEIPIISAVGHETDTTIADYVADLRAPTPSAAAELAVFDYARFQTVLADYRATLAADMRVRIREKAGLAEKYGLTLQYYSPKGRLRELRTRSMQLEEQLGRAMEQSIGDRRHALALLAERFKGLSPLDKLSHGYAYAEDAKGKVLRSIAGVKPGDGITVSVTDGRIFARVERTEDAPAWKEDEKDGGKKA